MIKNIIFDIGNVLTVFCWEKYFKSFGYTDEIVERLAIATVKNHIWAEYDRGVMSVDEIVKGFVDSAPELEEQIYKVTENLKGILERCDYAIPWIEELHSKGYRVYYLSNFFEKAERECADALDFIPYTDGGILSYREKLIKPDAAIYELLMERYGLSAEECVFIDDREENCSAARKLGMQAICFRTREQAVKELGEMGVR